MRPPMCAICKKDFRGKPNSGGRVYFKNSEEDEIYNQRFKEPGFVGHKRGMQWFCDDHFELAKTHNDLTWLEAYKVIKTKLKEKSDEEE